MGSAASMPQEVSYSQAQALAGSAWNRNWEAHFATSSGTIPKAVALMLWSLDAQRTARYTTERQTWASNAAPPPVVKQTERTYPVRAPPPEPTKKDEDKRSSRSGAVVAALAEATSRLESEKRALETRIAKLEEQETPDEQEEDEDEDEDDFPMDFSKVVTDLEAKLELVQSQLTEQRERRAAADKRGRSEKRALAGRVAELESQVVEMRRSERRRDADIHRELRAANAGLSRRLHEAESRLARRNNSGTDSSDRARVEACEAKNTLASQRIVELARKVEKGVESSSRADFENNLLFRVAAFERQVEEQGDNDLLRHLEAQVGDLLKRDPASPQTYNSPQRRDRGVEEAKEEGWEKVYNEELDSVPGSPAKDPFTIVKAAADDLEASSSSAASSSVVVAPIFRLATAEGYVGSSADSNGRLRSDATQLASALKLQLHPVQGGELLYQLREASGWLGVSQDAWLFARYPKPEAATFQFIQDGDAYIIKHHDDHASQKYLAFFEEGRWIHAISSREDAMRIALVKVDPDDPDGVMWKAARPVPSH